MAWTPDQSPELTATFTKPNGTPTDPDSIYVDVFDPSGTKVIDNGTPERIMEGFYSYTVDLGDDPLLGLWKIEWQAVVNGLNAFGDEVFEVLESPNVTPSDEVQRSRLRSRLAEVKKEGDLDGSGTFFNDVAITDLLTYAGNDLDRATLEGWLRKQAHYAPLIDVSESGSQRELSQKFEHATEMVEFWIQLLGDAADATSAALAGRIVGRAVCLRERPDPLSLQTPFSGYSEHVRMYPTHRLLIPAILS